jgi:hypothetical protein
MKAQIDIIDLVQPMVRLRRITTSDGSFIVLNDIANVFGIACGDIESILPSSLQVFSLQYEDGDIDASMRAVHYGDLFPLLESMFKHYAEEGDRKSAILCFELKYEIVGNENKWSIVK